MSRADYENIQSDLEGFIGVSCFFLSLLSVAQDVVDDYKLDKNIDMIKLYRVATNKGWLNKFDKIMYNDVALLEYATGVKVKKVIYTPSEFEGHTVKENEYTISKYVNAKGNMNHFRRRSYDVYKNSQTVAKGKLLSIYCYEFEVKK